MKPSSATAGPALPPEAFPVHWKWTALRDVADLLPSKSIASDGDTSVVAITTACLTELGFAPSGVKPARMRSRDAEDARVQPGEVLVARSNTSELVGRVAAFSGEPEDCVASDLTMRLMPKKPLSSGFLAGYLSLLYLSGHWRERAGGASGSMKKITRTQIRDLIIPVPPLEEQLRIALAVSEQLQAVARARAAAETRLAASSHLIAAYLNATFTAVDRGGWPRSRLGEVLALRKDVLHPRDHPSGPAVFVGLEHLESGSGRRIGCVELETSTLTGRKPRFRKGDLVYGYLRPYLNKVWVAEFDGLCSVDQYVYRVDDRKALTEFIAWFMRCPVYLERAPVDATPGQLPRIRTDEVAGVEFTLPPLERQSQIVSDLQRQVTAAHSISRAVEQEVAAMNALPAALLRGAFSGKL